METNQGGRSAAVAAGAILGAGIAFEAVRAVTRWPDVTAVPSRLESSLVMVFWAIAAAVALMIFRIVGVFPGGRVKLMAGRAPLRGAHGMCNQQEEHHGVARSRQSDSVTQHPHFPSIVVRAGRLGSPQR